MHAKAFATALALAVSLTGYSVLAQTGTTTGTTTVTPGSQTATPPPGAPARGVPNTTSPAAGEVVTQGAAVGQTTMAVTSAQDFVQQAASSGLFEVESSRMAMDSARNDQVRSFAQQMVTDHTTANQQLMSLARQQGMQPPAAMLPRHAQQLQTLQATPGPAFDAGYMQAQVAAHQEAVGLFEQASQSTAQDMGPFRSFAQQQLPTLRQHLQMAQSIAGTGVPTARQQ